VKAFRMIVAGGLLSTAIAATAQADTLANWTFEASVPSTAGPHVAEDGVFAGISLASGMHAAASAYSNPVGNGSVESFSSTAWSIGDYYQFTTSSTGYENLSFSIDHTSSNTGPRDFTVAWSTDGVSFTDFSSYMVLANATPNPVWTSGTYLPKYTSVFDLSSITALNDAASIYIRVVQNSNVSANGSTVASGGTSRVDNVIISGSLIPEPASLALLALGGLLIRRR
jgi:hypothetical protein